MAVGSLVLRIVVGGVFVGHGLQKLRGSFGGPGLEGTERMMENQAMYPPRENARLVAWSETLGGAAVIAGMTMPAAAAALTATMVTAVRKVHFKNGFWNPRGGWEYNLVLVSSLLALTAGGPGKVSIDAALGRSKWGLPWALFALGAGVVGSIGVVEFGRINAEKMVAAAAEHAANQG